MLVGTPESRELCQKVAQRTDTVLLGFSRGKDSIATVLWLKEFFPRIILFHKDGCPGIPFVEQSLTYYEDVFGVEIDRCYPSDLFTYIGSMRYQLIEDEDFIDDLDLGQFTYEHDDLTAWMRAKHKAPHAWLAWGLSYKDNLMRAVRSNLRDGWIEDKQVFYPIFDWARNDILGAIETAGVKLPGDYLYANRSFNDTVNSRHFERMATQSPKDWDAVRLLFPLIDAARARLGFRKMHFQAKSATDPDAQEPVAIEPEPESVSDSEY